MGRTWHPYAPDQAFGRRAARDEELVDAMLARMEARREPAPRAGNKANLTETTISFGSSAAWWSSPPGQFSAHGQFRAHGPFSWGPQTDEPSTIAAALEAAVHAREDANG
jgi:pectin methylesterase-like acyl-CoA thioesterase